MTRHCPICGKELIKHDNEPPNKFKNRITCGQGTDCQKAYNARKRTEYWLGDMVPGEDGKLVYTDPLDAEQAEINRACREAEIARMGITKDEGRVLSGTEIGRLIVTGQITPLSEIRHCADFNVFI